MPPTFSLPSEKPQASMRGTMSSGRVAGKEPKVPYKIELETRARREYRDLPVRVREQVADAIDDLQTNPLRREARNWSALPAIASGREITAFSTQLTTLHRWCACIVSGTVMRSIANPHFSQGFIARPRRRAWIQGASGGFSASATEGPAVHALVCQFPWISRLDFTTVANGRS